MKKEERINLRMTSRHKQGLKLLCDGETYSDYMEKLVEEYIKMKIFIIEGDISDHEKALFGNKDRIKTTIIKGFKYKAEVSLLKYKRALDIIYTK